MNNFKINLDIDLFWIWASPTHKTSIATSVYDSISSNNNCSGSWDGSNQIWKLCAISRVKFFIWKIIHGKLSTDALLYRLNFGSYMLCPFCWLEEETTGHLLWFCYKISCSWSIIINSLGLRVDDLSFLASGDSLMFDHYFRTGNAWAKALLASMAWLIWKDICNYIFKNLVPRFDTLISRA